jgi:hypothetical protein
MLTTAVQQVNKSVSVSRRRDRPLLRQMLNSKGQRLKRTGRSQNIEHRTSNAQHPISDSSCNLRKKFFRAFAFFAVQSVFIREIRGKNWPLDSYISSYQDTLIFYLHWSGLFVSL